jgi:hypothetical protein
MHRLFQRFWSAVWNPKPVRVRQVGADPDEIRAETSASRGSHDCTVYRTFIGEIRSRNDERLEPVWTEEWTRLADGIESRRDGDARILRVHVHGCPARVEVTRNTEYIAWDDDDHSFSRSSTEIIKFVSALA